MSDDKRDDRAVPMPMACNYDPSSAPTDPNEMTIIGIVEELQEDLRAYVKGSEPLSIVGFPDFLLTAVDRVRAAAAFDGDIRPSRSAVVACCISAAIDILNEHHAVMCLVELKREFDEENHEDGEAEEIVACFHRTFPVDVAIGGASKRRNMAIPGEIKRRLTGLADDLGATYSVLSVLLVMLALSTQPCVNGEQRDRMQEVVGGFLRRTKLRAVATQALVEALL